ncbi:MAG TPA: hypothetical protein VH309_05285 [Elusimicrobiota bacterium]|jgi:hypothetical protein|nr:hypothetical protein [Elusimicrobiota bacterium]
MGEHREPARPALETIKIRGLARLAAAIFAAWGGLVLFKGVWDLVGGEPEANLYAPQKWLFVTEAQWLRYSGFELAYGLACVALGWYCLRWARRLPETVSRPRREPDFTLFD